MILTKCMLLLLLTAGSISGHGGMVEPPMRSIMWRYGFDTPINYDWNGLYCGGFHVFQQSGGKCGLCGDPHTGPFDNDKGGMYDNGIIVRHYPLGLQEIEVKIDLTAFHKGYFTFKLCPNNDRPLSQECLERYPLLIRQGRQQGDPGRFYPKEGPKVYDLMVELPRGVRCDRCVLQWTYTAGNSDGQGADGRRCVGCGLQETFVNCADISINGTVDKITVEKSPRAPRNNAEGPEIIIPEISHLGIMSQGLSQRAPTDVRNTDNAGERRPQRRDQSAVPLRRLPSQSEGRRQRVTAPSRPNQVVDRPRVTSPIDMPADFGNSLLDSPDLQLQPDAMAFTNEELGPESTGHSDWLPPLPDLPPDVAAADRHGHLGLPPEWLSQLEPLDPAIDAALGPPHDLLNEPGMFDNRAIPELRSVSRNQPNVDNGIRRREPMSNVIRNRADLLPESRMLENNASPVLRPASRNQPNIDNGIRRSEPTRVFPGNRVMNTGLSIFPPSSHTRNTIPSNTINGWDSGRSARPALTRSDLRAFRRSGLQQHRWNQPSRDLSGTRLTRDRASRFQSSLGHSRHLPMTSAVHQRRLEILRRRGRRMPTPSHQHHRRDSIGADRFSHDVVRNRQIRLMAERHLGRRLPPLNRFSNRHAHWAPARLENLLPDRAVRPLRRSSMMTRNNVNVPSRRSSASNRGHLQPTRPTPRRVVVHNAAMARYILRNYPHLRGRVYLSQQAHMRSKYGGMAHRYRKRRRW